MLIERLGGQVKRAGVSVESCGHAGGGVAESAWVLEIG